MRKTHLAVMVVVMLSLLVCPFVRADESVEWPCWRGANHDGMSPDTGLLKQWPADGPKLLWHNKGLGKGFSTVAVSGGTIYTSGDVGGNFVVFAFDMDGKDKWKVPVDKAWTRSHPGSRSTPTISDGKVYVLSGNGLVSCISTADGGKKWSKSLKDFGGKSGGWGYAESVLIDGDLAIVKPGGKNAMVALDKNTGETVWQSTGFDAGPEYSSCVPLTHDGVDMIMTGSRGGVFAVSAKTGKTLWSNKWCAGNVANCPDPQYADGYVFWSNGYGKGGVCLELSKAGDGVDAKEIWTTKDLVCHHGGYVLLDGHIYGNHNGGWTCLELKTGKVKWDEKAVGKGSCTYADGMLYLFGENGGKAAVAAFSPEGMEVKGNVTVQGSGPSWAHPVVIGGRLYLRYDDNLYCFDVKAG